MSGPACKIDFFFYESIGPVITPGGSVHTKHNRARLNQSLGHRFCSMAQM